MFPLYSRRSEEISRFSAGSGQKDAEKECWEPTSLVTTTSNASTSPSDVSRASRCAQADVDASSDGERNRSDLLPLDAKAAESGRTPPGGFDDEFTMELPEGVGACASVETKTFHLRHTLSSTSFSSSLNALQIPIQHGVSQKSESLFVTVANALADIFALSGDEAEETYERFVSKLVDCTSRSPKEHHTVVIVLLREVANLLQMNTVTPWHAAKTPATEREQHLSEEFVRAVFIGPRNGYEDKRHEEWVGEGEGEVAVAGAGGGQIILHPDIARLSRRHRWSCASADGTNVSLSFTLSILVGMAALAHLHCETTLHPIKHDRPVFPPRADFSVRARYCGARVAFVVSFAGEAPCSIRFHRPCRLTRLRHSRQFASLIADVCAIIAQFENHVLHCVDDLSLARINMP